LLRPPDPGGRLDLLLLLAEAVAAGRRGGIGRDLISSWQGDGRARLELGDRAGAVAAAGECERAAKELRIDHTAVVLSGLRALLAMLDGRFDDADQLTEEAELAAGSGDPSAGLGRFAVLVGIARERGDYRAYLPQMEMLAMLPELPGLRAEVGYAYLTAGRADDARVILDAFAADDLGGVPNNWGRPSALQDLTELATDLEVTEIAGKLLDLLDPYAGQLLIAYGTATCRGAADRARGQLLSLLGRDREAAEAFAAALRLEASVGGRSLLPRTRYRYARALLAHADGDHAYELLEEAGVEARTLGMAGLERAIAAKVAARS
jgi:tetratricopeptide (TPR) repeat protein